MMALVIAGGVFLAASLTLARLFAGPTFYDRALTALSVNAKLAVVVAAVGVMSGRAALIDQAIAQVAIGYILAVAVLKVLRMRSLQPALDHGPSAEAEA